MASQAARKLLSASLLVPPSIYFNDTFYMAYRVRGDSMEPALCDGDVVLIRKVDFLPRYFRNKFTVDDLLDDESDKLEEENDIQKALRMDASVGKSPGDNLTLWRSPPNVMPGDIIAFTNPEAQENTEIKRLIGIGGQRIRPKAAYHSIEYLGPFSVWVESDKGADGYSGTVSKKLLHGKVDCILWPPSRVGNTVERRRSVGRAWWP